MASVLLRTMYSMSIPYYNAHNRQYSTGSGFFWGLLIGNALADNNMKSPPPNLQDHSKQIKLIEEFIELLEHRKTTSPQVFENLLKNETHRYKELVKDLKFKYQHKLM